MALASIPSPSQGVWYLGPIPLRAYALCIAIGVVVAVIMGERRWRARGGTPGTIIDLAVWAVPFGLVGGRLYHVITDWQLYFGADAPNRPIDALYVWHGGLGIWGAVALGAVGVWIGCRRRGIALSAVADVLAPAVAVGQAIGRWGNYFNQELFGGPTSLPWGLEIDPGRPGTVPGELTYHPTFLYESLWDLALALALIWVGRRFALRHGRLFMLYVAGYTVGRFWIEGMRVDPAHHIMGLRLNQWTSIVIFAGAVAFFLLTRNKTSEESLGVVDEVDPAHSADQADDHESGLTTSTEPGTDTAEPGSAETGSAETGSAEPSTVEVGADGTGGDGTGSAETDSAEPSTVEVGADGTGADGTGGAETGSAEAVGAETSVGEDGDGPDPAHQAGDADEGEKAESGLKREATQR